MPNDVRSIAGPPVPFVRCKTDGDASWLQVDRIGSQNALPDIKGSEGEAWGLHDQAAAFGRP